MKSGAYDCYTISANRCTKILQTARFREEKVSCLMGWAVIFTFFNSFIIFYVTIVFSQ